MAERSLLTPAATLVALAALATPALALDVPPLRAHVNDEASLLEPAERQALERKLTAYERGSGNQFALLVIPSLEGEPLEDFSMRVAEAWKIGQRGKDNGLLMLVVTQDRKIRIDTGYGLEGDIPDVLASRIIRNVMQPAFRDHHYAAGINQAFDLLIKAAGGESVEVPSASRPRPRSSLAGWIFFVLLMLFLLRGRGAGWFLLGSMLGGGWSSRGGGFRGGGGFGGGGGFSGGGGSFGGGGASGGW
jgi:uncharacterized protein